MIGHYVHHHGSGHLNRARTLAAALPWEVTGLSSLPRPEGWSGDWVQLPRDDTDPYAATRSPTAHDRLHWAPLHDTGLLERQATVAQWLRECRPGVLVVDQSVEVTVLARLHGIPVLGMTAPGHRGDAAHALGFACSEALVGAWPAGFTPRLLPGVHPDTVARFAGIGAVSRFAVASRRPRQPGRPRVALLCGDGGDSFDAATVERMQAGAPHWEWKVLSRRLGGWVPDPSEVLSQADVVITHAGQNAVAEVASLRVPAIVIPQDRPFEEQQVMAEVLRDHMPVLVLPSTEGVDWSEALNHAKSLEGDDWQLWSDGQAALRMEELVGDLLEQRVG